MRTTADPRTLFRTVDGTGAADAGSYEFNVATESASANIVGEGEEVPKTTAETETIRVKFKDFVDEDTEKSMALDALLDSASAHLADAPIETGYDYNTLFIDRENDQAYLVDTSRFGYKMVSEFDDDGNAVEGAYAGIFSDAALRVR